jgi:hypothetical protein
MEIQFGSPSDAEAIARLIASFQSELTDDPSGAGRGVSRLRVCASRARIPNLATLSIPPCIRWFSARRRHRYPRRLPSISPLRRACTPTPRRRSRLVGASIARVGPSRESRSFHSQLKPCDRAGLPGVRFPSCWVNKKRPWHLVPSNAVPRG